jgi:hypothetical protein
MCWDVFMWRKKKHMTSSWNCSDDAWNKNSKNIFLRTMTPKKTMSSGFYGDSTCNERPGKNIISCFMCGRKRELAYSFGILPLCDVCYNEMANFALQRMARYSK